MKIKRLRFLNCLGIEELAINPGSVTKISGGNEKGKTSILESIEKALSNTKRRDKFVRVGADKAVIELETDTGLQIVRTVKEDAEGNDQGTVKVLQDGKPVTRPQTYLDELFRASGKRSDVFAFNPVDFLAKKDRDQTDILLGMMPVEFSEADAKVAFGDAFPALDYSRHGLQIMKALEKHFYDARWAANGKVKAITEEVDALRNRLPDNYDLAKWEAISLAEMYGNVRLAQEINQKRIDAQRVIDSHDERVASLNQKILLGERDIHDFAEFRLKKANDELAAQKADIQDQINDIDAHIADLLRRKVGLEAQIAAIGTVSAAERAKAVEEEKVAKLRALHAEMDVVMDRYEGELKIAEAYLQNNAEQNVELLEHQAKHVEQMKGYNALAHDLISVERNLSTWTDLAQRYDSYVEFCRSYPATILSQIELPVKGLGVDDNGLVTIDGLPIKNLSTARQVRVCLDIARAYAKNSALKLICVDRLESLDNDAREEFFRQISDDDDFQWFTTTVTNGDLLIEGGN